MLDLLSRNIVNLLSNTNHINEEDCNPITMSYKVTVSVECIWPDEKYWQPMLRNQTVTKTDDWITQLSKVIAPLLEETLCITDNQEENDKACSLLMMLTHFNELNEVS